MKPSQNSVSQRLYEQTGIAIGPGATGKCFKCGKGTFTVAADRTFGRCNECFASMQAQAQCPPGKMAMHRRFFTEVALVCALALWRGANRLSTLAVEKLQKLGFQEALLRAFGVGVIPETLDAEGLAKLVPEKSDDTDCPNPRALALDYIKERLTPLAGCILFPHSDAHHNITGFRALDADGLFRDLRLTPGLFHTHAYPTTGVAHPALGSRIIVVQNELCWLRLQQGMLAGGFQLLRGCATGAPLMANVPTLDELTGEKAVRPLVLDDVPTHTFILSLPATLQQHMTVDSWETTSIEQLLKNEAQIIKALQEAEKNARVLYRPYSALTMELYGIRKEFAGLAQEFIAHREVAERVVRDLLRRGEFLTSDGAAYWMNSETKTVISIRGREAPFVSDVC